MKTTGVFLLILWIISTSLAFGGIIVVIKDGRVQRLDEKGSYRGIVGSLGAVQTVTDGEFIFILYEDGRVIRYDATGSYKGIIGSSAAKGVQVGAGQVIISYAKGPTKRYDAKTGSYKGML